MFFLELHSSFYNFLFSSRWACDVPQSPHAFLQKLAILCSAELIHLPSLANCRQNSLSS